MSASLIIREIVVLINKKPSYNNFVDEANKKLVKIDQNGTNLTDSILKILSNFLAIPIKTS